jgi:hypothetical protein
VEIGSRADEKDILSASRLVHGKQREAPLSPTPRPRQTITRARDTLGRCALLTPSLDRPTEFDDDHVQLEYPCFVANSTLPRTSEHLKKNILPLGYVTFSYKFRRKPICSLTIIKCVSSTKNKKTVVCVAVS